MEMREIRIKSVRKGFIVTQKREGDIKPVIDTYPTLSDVLKVVSEYFTGHGRENGK